MVNIKFLLTAALSTAFLIIQAQNKLESEMLIHLNGKKIEWMTDYYEELAKVQNKNTKLWGLYQVCYMCIEYDIKIGEDDWYKIDTVLLPIYEEILPENYQSYFVKKDKKYTNLKVMKDEKGKINILTQKKILYFEEIKKYDEFFILVKIEGKWGMYTWVEDKLIHTCKYKSYKDVPAPDEVIEEESREITTKEKLLQKKLNSDQIENDPINGDGVFRAHSEETQKWGMYQDLGSEIKELIPMEYDSIRFFPFNGNFTAVYNDDKVGFYLSKWTYEDLAKQSVTCLYENYQRFTPDDGITRLAVQKENKWGWIDWLTGEEKSAFIYDSTEELPYPNFEQKTWFDK